MRLAGRVGGETVRDAILAAQSEPRSGIAIPVDRALGGRDVPHRRLSMASQYSIIDPGSRHGGRKSTRSTPRPEPVMTAAVIHASTISSMGSGSWDPVTGMLRESQFQNGEHRVNDVLSRLLAWPAWLCTPGTCGTDAIRHQSSLVSSELVRCRGLVTLPRYSSLRRSQWR
jgi:hypothetical protein